MHNTSPKPPRTIPQAINLHMFGVQVKWDIPFGKSDHESGGAGSPPPTERDREPVWELSSGPVTYTPNVPPLRALWSLLVGIWGTLKGSWGVLAEL